MRGGVQSITDLSMGLHLSGMLTDLTANVHQVLESGMSGRKPGETHYTACDVNLLLLVGYHHIRLIHDTLAFQCE